MTDAGKIVVTAGPKKKELIFRRMAQLAIPSGCPDPVSEGARVFLTADRWRTIVSQATEWVEARFAELRSTSEYAGKSDEEIAGDLLAYLQTVKDIAKKKCTEEGKGNG